MQAIPSTAFVYMQHFPSDLVPLSTMPWDARPDDLRLDIEECRTALWSCNGNISQAATMLKVTSIRLRRFVDQSPRLSAELQEARELLMDLSEQNVADALQDTDDKMRRDNMSKFVLTNLGAKRGYGPKGAGITLNPQGKSGAFTISWGDGSSIAADNQGNTIEHE
jgi:hypothetical protein